MTKFLSDCVNKYRECSGFEGDFPKVPTPNLVENTREHKARNPNFEIKEGASPAARHGKARAQTALSLPRSGTNKYVRLLKQLSHFLENDL